MVKNELEPEVNEILKHIDKGENFVLSGGAGSGKTYSLVQLIMEIINNNPTSKIACITYTNAAVRLIEERVKNKNLEISTFHDFLWDNIKSFQCELKKSLIYLIKDENSKIKSSDGNIDNSYYDSIEEGIQYKEYTKIKSGIVSHNEVLELANYMYKTYPLLCSILKDKYNFILIDEYQDTSPLVIEILLTHLKQSKKKNVVGFFGDAMQSIYDDGIGNLIKYIDSGDVIEIQKKQNRRNPQLIIDLANKLRTDGLQQKPSGDKNAPNMVNGKIKEGRIKFIYSQDNDLDNIKNQCKNTIFKDWNFDDSKQTKELNLTHNLIAAKAGYPELWEIYYNDPIIKFRNEILAEIRKKEMNIDDNKTFDEIAKLVPLQNRQRQNKLDLIIQNNFSNSLYIQLKDLPFLEIKKIYLNKDSLIDDAKHDVNDENKKGSRRDNLIKHLFKIQSLIYLYNEKRYNEFIRKTEFRINSIADKKKLNKIINKFVNQDNQTIGDIIEIANIEGICKKDDSINGFIKDNEYIYNRVKEVKYKEFQNLYFYLEGFTPFSTQHKTKGTEFDNVFMILDNGKWNNYNFEYLFTNRTDKKSVLSRSQKIFYVCCTRAKENLVVFYHAPNVAILNTAKQWFGDKNLIEI